MTAGALGALRRRHLSRQLQDAIREEQTRSQLQSLAREFCRENDKVRRDLACYGGSHAVEVSA